MKSLGVYYWYIKYGGEQPEQRILAYKQNSQLPVV